VLLAIPIPSKLRIQHPIAKADGPTFLIFNIQRGDQGRRGRRPGFSGPSPGGSVDLLPLDRIPPNTVVLPPRDSRFGPRDGGHFHQGPGVRDDEPRFDRGGREEEPQFDRGAPEHSPGSHDFPPLGGGAPPYEGGGQPQAGPFEGDPLGAPMFDHFNGPPMRGLPGGLFVPDMPGPPQVLMPVPGAG
jgi:hypothetical protein